jgi:hypothetical protein
LFLTLSIDFFRKVGENGKHIWLSVNPTSPGTPPVFHKPGEKYQPDLCRAGHIHEGKGVNTIGRTTIINPGM